MVGIVPATNQVLGTGTLSHCTILVIRDAYFRNARGGIQKVSAALISSW